jgi:hypothetical protein
MNFKFQSTKLLVCSLCGQDTQPVSQCEGGYVCEVCASRSRHGRDTSTRTAKTLQRAMRGQAQKVRAQFNDEAVDELLEYDIASSEMMAADAFQQTTTIKLIAGGEVLPEHDPQLVDTLAAPCVIALDASVNRLELISAMGTDVTAMALDASDTIGAANSLEKMLAHQLAVCHDSAMRYVTKASLERDALHSVRMMNLATRSMETFQKGLLTLKRMRANGEQRIMVQHVDVREGGQAVIGQLAPGRGGAK